MRRLLRLPLLLLALFRAPFAIVRKDAVRWCEVQQRSARGTPAILDLLGMPEFRSLCYHRFRHHGGAAARLVAQFLAVFYRPLGSLYLHTREIGEGLYIQHGFSTIVVARRVGRNCWISQQVTVGYRDSGEGPILEDGVRIYAGAKVLGAITIGRNTRVGANAVVVKDAPADCTLVGVPARMVERS